MGGMVERIEARTVTELRRKSQKWQGKVREMGLDVRVQFAPENVVEDGDGTMSVTLWAHT